MDEKMKEIKEKFKDIDFYAIYKVCGGDLYYMISTIELLETDFEKERQRLATEIWTLKQEKATMRNYIKFKSLEAEFDSWSLEE